MNIVDPSEYNREIIPVRNGGAGRGARLLLPAIQEFNQRSERFAIEPWYVDPAPSRAKDLVAEARSAGVHARASEGRIEDFVRRARSRRPSPIILNLDRPLALAKVLGVAAETDQPVLAYMLLRTPSEELYGLRLVFQGHENDLKRQAARFFEALARVVARSGASFIVGNGGRPEHIATEPAYRLWFAQHMQANVPKVAGQAEPEASPFEVTRDGTSTLCLTIVENKRAWANPASLAQEVISDPPLPLIRGQDFAVGEVGPDGVRIHRVRLRKTDGKVAIRGSTLVNPEAIAAAEERERARRELERALSKAEHDTISRVRPAFTTD